MCDSRDEVIRLSLRVEAAIAAVSDELMSRFSDVEVDGFCMREPQARLIAFGVVSRLCSLDAYGPSGRTGP